MNSEELAEVRAEMLTRLAVLAKNLRELDEINEFVSKLAPEMDAADQWRRFTAGELTLGEKAEWSEVTV